MIPISYLIEATNKTPAIQAEYVYSVAYTTNESFTSYGTPNSYEAKVTANVTDFRMSVPSDSSLGITTTSYIQSTKQSLVSLDDAISSAQADALSIAIAVCIGTCRGELILQKTPPTPLPKPIPQPNAMSIEVKNSVLKICITRMFPTPMDVVQAFTAVGPYEFPDPLFPPPFDFKIPNPMFGSTDKPSRNVLYVASDAIGTAAKAVWNKILEWLGKFLGVIGMSVSNLLKLVSDAIKEMCGVFMDAADVLAGNMAALTTKIGKQISEASGALKEKINSIFLSEGSEKKKDEPEQTLWRSIQVWCSNFYVTLCNKVLEIFGTMKEMFNNSGLGSLAGKLADLPTKLPTSKEVSDMMSTFTGTISEKFDKVLSAFSLNGLNIKWPEWNFEQEADKDDPEHSLWVQIYTFCSNIWVALGKLVADTVKSIIDLVSSLAAPLKEAANALISMVLNIEIFPMCMSIPLTAVLYKSLGLPVPALGIVSVAGNTAGAVNL